jgi:hypothetical protein
MPRRYLNWNFYISTFFYLRRLQNPHYSLSLFCSFVKKVVMLNYLKWQYFYTPFVSLTSFFNKTYAIVGLFLSCCAIVQLDSYSFHSHFPLVHLINNKKGTI